MKKRIRDRRSRPGARRRRAPGGRVRVPGHSSVRPLRRGSAIDTPSQDPQSVRLLSPASWVQGVCTAEGSWRGPSHRHYGAPLAEVEFMPTARDGYSPNRLNRYSLVQIVAGAPAGDGRSQGAPPCRAAGRNPGVERATLLGTPGGLTGFGVDG